MKSKNEFLSKHTSVSCVCEWKCQVGVVLISSIVEKKGPKDHIGLFFQTVTFKYYNGMFFSKLDMK